MSDFNDKPLRDLIKAFSGKMPETRVGVLGSKTTRSKGGNQTNAEIGAKHEFGEDGMPVRSFLRVPLIDRLDAALQKAGAFTEVTLRQVIRDKSIYQWMKKIGIVAEGVVAEGFATGGFGKWKPSNMAHKTNHQTLVETKQLRDSITSEVT